MGGAAGTASTACAGVKPTAPLVTSFADLVANTANAGQFTFTAGLPGGTFSYQKTDNLVLADSGMALHVTGKIVGYDGFGVYLNTCYDSSMYTGVSFNIKGNAGATGKMNFRVQTNATTAIDTANKKGTCVVPTGADSYTSCHAASVDIPSPLRAGSST